MNWMLIIVLAILGINTLIGMKVGFIKTVFSLFSMIIALGLTLWISPYVNDVMKGNDKLYQTISTKVEKILPFVEEEADKKAQESIIEEMKLPKAIKKSLLENNNKKTYKVLLVDTFEEYMKSYLTGIIIKALAFSITFIVILILLWAISIALHIISKLPLLKQINKLGGLVAGFVHGLVVVWLLFIVLTVFGSSEWGQRAMEMIGEDQILSMIYDNNFIITFITGATTMLK